QLGSVRGVVRWRHLFDEFQARHSAQQPAAQRPGGIVFAADGENGLGHLHAPLLHLYAALMPARGSGFRTPWSRERVELIGQIQTLRSIRSVTPNGLSELSACSDTRGPTRAIAEIAATVFAHPRLGVSRNRVHRAGAALCELVARAGLSRQRPASEVTPSTYAGRLTRVRGQRFTGPLPHPAAP